MVATDLDGTLLRTDGSVSPRSRAALRAADAAGLLVVFATGRPPRWLHEVADTVGHVGIAVAANGAVLYDVGAERDVFTHPLPVADLVAITAALRTAYPDARFATEYGMQFAHEPGYRHDWEIMPRDRTGRDLPAVVEAPLERLVERPAIKLLAKDRDADPDEFGRGASALLDGVATVVHSSSFGLVEISALGVTKASGLARLAERCGIAAADVVAIGDMPNDLAMLQWAGRSYAVGNAHPAVRAVADEVVATNDEDAVAVLIEQVLAG